MRGESEERGKGSLVDRGVVEGVVYIGREDAPSWKTVHHTTPKEGATSTHLCVCVCVCVCVL